MAPDMNVNFKQIFAYEAVMSNIKKRLKEAYDNVTFYANKTWTNDYYLYQKANQELYGRHIKIQDTFAKEVTRARTVRDSIPQSKLAQYSNYEYDESRELSYTPNGTDVIFHYPCRNKEDAIEEPWMLPEVEQLFIWLTYSRDFNLLRYRELADFEHTENRDKTKHTCTLEDFHKIDPRFYENFERTPGKSRFTSADAIPDAELNTLLPSFMKFDTFEDMTVKMKINLDTIKNIWQTSRADDVIPPKKVQVFKSSFDNLFVNENSRSLKYLQHPEYMCLENVHFRELQEEANDFRNLQNLSDLLKKLKECTANQNVKSTRIYISSARSDADAATKSPPTKRLYSDVVQGLVANKECPSQTQFAPSVEQSSSKELLFALPKLQCIEDVSVPQPSQSFKYNSFLKNRPPTPPLNWIEPSTSKPEAKCFQKVEEKKGVEFNFTPKCVANSQSSYGKSCLGNTTYTDAFANTTINTYSNNYISNHPNYFTGNLISNECQPNEIYGTYPNHAYHNPNNYQNIYTNNYYMSPFQFAQNNVYCNSFSGATFPASTYTYPQSSYTNQISSNARHFVQQKQNAAHFSNTGQQWIMHQYRTPSIYNITHFPPQPYFLLPPQLPKQQRWVQTPQYVRPPTPQMFHINTTASHTPPQNWGIQNQPHKTNSTHHVCAQNQHQAIDISSSVHNLDLRQKYKSRKINSQTNLAYNKIRNRSPDSLQYGDKEYGLKFKSNTASKRSSVSSEMAYSSNPKILVKATNSIDSMDYKFIMKKNSTTQADTNVLDPNSSTSAQKEFDCDSASLPVTTSTSEELERQALDEYQSSNESFYKELERQAEEQYEDSENLFGPPNEDLQFGGLTFTCGLSNFCRNELLSKCFQVHVYT